MSDKLKKICQSFKKGLEAIREQVLADPGMKELAGQDTNFGCPKKHVIYSAFAHCDEVLRSEFHADVKWRCGVGKPKGASQSKVEMILAKVYPLAGCGEDGGWPTIKEFMFDFSFSNFSFPRLTGQEEGFPENASFQLLLAAESEVQGYNLEDRRNLVTRDLVKLCLVASKVKVLVYKGYENTNSEKGNRAAMIDAIQRTIKRCHKDKILEEWLFLGLLKKWPDAQTAYAHILTPEKNSMTEMNEW